MADNLTLRLKEELEKRHGKIVSEADVSSFLQSQGLLSGGAAVPQTPQPIQSPQSALAPSYEGVPPWEIPQNLPDQESKSSLINAVGAGLWTFFDVASFGALGGAAGYEEKQGDEAFR